MTPTGRVFAAVFFAGIVSLILELSLLREFVYVVGSSAFSNSLIISVFLAGLAAGTYAGLWKPFLPKTRDAARRKFFRLGMLQAVFIFLFYVTKEYFIYVSQSEPLIIGYFVLSTFIPALIAGAAYTAVVQLLYHGGERYIVYVYAVSTIGNVVGGLIWGYVFVYVLGIQASYVLASVCSLIAALLVMPGGPRSAIVPVLLLALLPAAIRTNAVNGRLYRYDDLLYRRESPFGPVEIWQTPDGEAIQMTIGNVHQYYNYEWDNRVHRQWAETALDVTGRPSDVLLLGYGSGISTAAFLDSPLTRRVDTVENCYPVMDAGRIFFPKTYAKVIGDPRSSIVVDDFRRHIRFTDRTYDIILLDHSIDDPYYAGFFTLDFFRQLKRILKPGGVIASLDVGLSYDTTRSAFPYMYRYTAPGRDLISSGGYFLMTEPVRAAVADRFAAEGPADGSEPVYTDHRIYGNSFRMALKAIKKRVTHGSL